MFLLVTEFCCISLKTAEVVLVYLDNLHINYILLGIASKVSYFKINSTLLLMHGPFSESTDLSSHLYNVWTLLFCILCLVFYLFMVAKQWSWQIF